MPLKKGVHVQFQFDHGSDKFAREITTESFEATNVAAWCCAVV